MSCHWDLVCETCDAYLGAHINHGEVELCGFLSAGGLRLFAALEPVANLLEYRPKLEGSCSLNGQDLVQFCAAHKDHAVVVRNEYGMNSGACGAVYSCGACGHQERCRRKRGHDGEHGDGTRSA